MPFSQGELLDTVMGIFAKCNQYASEAEQMSIVQQKGAPEVASM